MPIRPDFFHAAHAVHGSVYFEALDDASFFAVHSLVTDVFVLTASYNIYLTRPVAEGTLRSAGRVVHRSKNVLIAEAELFDDQTRHVGRGSGGFMRSNIRSTPTSDTSKLTTHGRDGHERILSNAHFGLGRVGFLVDLSVRVSPIRSICVTKLFRPQSENPP